MHDWEGRSGFMLDRVVRSRILTFAISCGLHAAVIAGVLFGEHWLLSSVSPRPAVAAIELVVVPPPPEPPRPAPEPARPKPPAPAPPRPLRPPRLLDKPLPEVAKSEPPIPDPVPEPPAKAEPPVKPEPPATPEPPVKAEPPAPAALVAAAPASTAAPAPSAPQPPLTRPAPPTRPGIEAMPGPPGAIESATSSKAPDGLALGRGAPGTGPSGTPVPGSVVAAAPSRPGATGAITQYARPQGGYQVRPSYPSTARRLGIQGTAVLKVEVLADGRVGDIVVQQTAGHPDLDQAATDAVRRWRFEPGRRGDEPVAMWVLLPVEFRLR